MFNFFDKNPTIPKTVNKDIVEVSITPISINDAVDVLTRELAKDAPEFKTNVVEKLHKLLVDTRVYVSEQSNAESAVATLQTSSSHVSLSKAAMCLLIAEGQLNAASLEKRRWTQARVDATEYEAAAIDNVIRWTNVINKLKYKIGAY